MSAGTYLDSQRFRVHLGKHFSVDPAHVEAQVIGDHGTVRVFLWSSARVGGVPITTLLKKRGENLKDLRERIEKEVRYANITIIEGHNASQYGIGIGINDLCSTGRIHRHGDTLPILAKLNVEQFRALGPLLALFGRIVVAL